jgi:hypothetical protein
VHSSWVLLIDAVYAATVGVTAVRVRVRNTG